MCIMKKQLQPTSAIAAVCASVQHFIPRFELHCSRNFMVLFFLLACITLSTGQAVPFSASPYSQDFQSILATNLTPVGVANTTMLQVSDQTGGGTVTGWYLYGVSGT